MGYINEKAAKFNHKFIIENDIISDFLGRYEIKCNPTNFIESLINLDSINDTFKSEIKKIIVVDSGYQEIVREHLGNIYKICFQSYVIMESRVDFINLKSNIINPNDVYNANLQRFSICIPTKNLTLKNKNFKQTIIESVFEIFRGNGVGDSIESKDFVHFTQHTKDYIESKNSLLATIKYLIFKEYDNGKGKFNVECPHCMGIEVFKKQVQNYLDSKNDFIMCKNCTQKIYITDCFKLHYFIKEEALESSDIIFYLSQIFEILLLFSKIRFYIESGRFSELSEILFIRDGTLSLYFGSLLDFSAKCIRPFLQFLYDKSLQDKKSYVNFIGLSKSGIFTQNLNYLNRYMLPNDTLLLLNNDFIQNYILRNANGIFGQNTYFGIKMFVKRSNNFCFVLDISLPFGIESNYNDYIKAPNIKDFLNLKSILNILFSLKCDLYHNSFIPVAMVNKLTSLSNIPSKKILSIFTDDILK